MSRPLSSPRLAATAASLLAAALCACAVFWVAFVLLALPEPVAVALGLGVQVVLQVLVARALLGVGRRLLPAHLAYAFASWTGACVLIVAGAPASSALGTVALTAMPAGAVLCGLWAAAAPRRADAVRDRGRRALDAEARGLAGAGWQDGGAGRTTAPPAEPPLTRAPGR